MTERSYEPVIDEQLRSICLIPLLSNSYRVLYSIGGMTCAACVNAIMDALKDKLGVSKMSVDLLSKSGSALVTQADLGDEIKDTIEIIGYECEVVALKCVSEKSVDAHDAYETVLSIGGMTYSSCKLTISWGLLSLDFVQSVDINLLGHSGTVTFSTWENTANIKYMVEEMGYDCDIFGLFKLGM